MKPETRPKIEAAIEPYVGLLSPTAKGELSELLAAAILEEAITWPDESSEHAIGIDRRTEKVFFFDLTKAFLAAARVLTSIGALIISPNLAAVSAVLASLASLQGIRVRLSREQALVCLLLSQMPQRRSTLEDLAAAFDAFVLGHQAGGLRSLDLNATLQALRNLGCVELQNGRITFGQVIAIRR
jgi:hypothetical protein